MSFGGLLIHRAFVRSVDRQTDPFGGSIELEQRERVLRCRLDTPGGGEKSTASLSDTLFLQFKIFFGADAGVVEGDHINRIENDEGEVLAQDVDVLHVKRQEGMLSTHHFEVTGQSFIETGVS